MSSTSSGPEAALCLTQQEWDDLAHMVSHYRATTAWVLDPAERRAYAVKESEHLEVMDRRRKLALRIMDAA